MEGKNPIGTADLEWIFARNCEGTVQLQYQKLTERKQTGEGQNREDGETAGRKL